MSPFRAATVIVPNDPDDIRSGTDGSHRSDHAPRQRYKYSGQDVYSLLDSRQVAPSAVHVEFIRFTGPDCLRNTVRSMVFMGPEQRATRSGMDVDIESMLLADQDGAPCMLVSC